MSDLNANPVLLWSTQTRVEPSLPPERGEQKIHAAAHLLFGNTNTMGASSIQQVLYSLSNKAVVAFLCACHRTGCKKWVPLSSVEKCCRSGNNVSRGFPGCKTKE